ncbi:hypothetical protein QBC46DRAFT_353249 [Diplogelasinospora grovesii]|uniref:HNH nuclease domain-containing protein n=1 Tax=Diplogelasinospora grovesii TaxID=303347 RepID=A0AAN6S5N9_9PEZI|nr:hypothetical protein QBC46DRAFT_353249 [Diplogelasinospora grovesii]
MDTVASDISPAEEPVTDYITEIDVRCELFTKFRAIAQQFEPNSWRDHANATMLAMFMVAPVHQLQIFVGSCETTFQQGYSMLLAINTAGPLAIRAFVPKGRPNASRFDTPLLAPPSQTLGTSAEEKRDRDAEVAQLVKARDGHRCVFSGLTDPCSAHIFPHATSQTRDFQNLNPLLLHLWGEEQGKVWAQQYQLLTETEATQNGISMNHQIHHWFDNAKFALKPLKPLGQDNNSIVVQWHWLKPTIFKPKDRTCRYDSTATILERAGLTDKNWGTCLAHRESGIPIRNGQIFTIRAENPEDLPSWDLLELSWNLLRVAAICGAADVPDDYYDESDDDDEEWPEHAVIAAITARQA